MIVGKLITPTTAKSTKFPVRIGDTVVYYAKDNFDRMRFKNTNKYSKYLAWYENFRSE